MKNELKNSLEDSLIKVLREFGIVGVLTYAGGIIVLSGFLFEQDFQRQVTLGIMGLVLLSLSSAIAYFRLKIRKDREQALIDMVKNTGNRLSEQLAKGLTNEQVVSITQTVWQNQKDIIINILNQEGTKLQLNEKI